MIHAASSFRLMGGGEHMGRMDVASLWAPHHRGPKLSAAMRQVDTGSQCCLQNRLALRHFYHLAQWLYHDPVFHTEPLKMFLLIPKIYAKFIPETLGPWSIGYAGPDFLIIS